MAKGDCVKCTHCAVCKHRSSNEQPWVEEHCKLAARDERSHGEWIPCSERLPDKIGDYIVSDIYGQVFSSTFDYVLKEKCFGYDNDDRDFVKDDTVVAWMPLPKPYREEGDLNEI